MEYAQPRDACAMRSCDKFSIYRGCASRTHCAAAHIPYTSTSIVHPDEKLVPQKIDIADARQRRAGHSLYSCVYEYTQMFHEP